MVKYFYDFCELACCASDTHVHTLSGRTSLRT